MGWSKGYRSYRGRAPRWKILAAILLCLVILAAAGVIWAQGHIVFDAEGMAHLDLPWQREETEPAEDPGELDLVIQEPAAPPEVRAWQTNAAPLTAEAAESAWTAAEQLGCNAVVIPVKDREGRIFFDSQTAVPGTVETAADTAAALAAILAEDAGGADYAAARISCLLDPAASKEDIDGMSLKNTGGYIFYDGNNATWLDPGKEKTRAYLSHLAVECAKLGFDELLLSDLTFPTQGKLDKIAYPAGERSAALGSVLKEIRAALDEHGFQAVRLSVDLPETVLVTGADEDAGLDLKMIAGAVDRIYGTVAADQMESAARAVAAAGAVFVPEVSPETLPETGSCLVLS